MITQINNCTLGVYTVASASPKVSLADPAGNLVNIFSLLSEEELRQASIIVLPELCITGYTCGDLFFQSALISEALEAFINLCKALKDDDRMIAVGLPVLKDGKLYNCAAVIAKGELLGLVPKSYIPNYQEFYEKRWFSSGQGIKNEFIEIDGVQVPFGTDLIFEYMDAKIGVEICEDLWVPIPPSSHLCASGAEIILNLSATDDNIGKYEYIRRLVESQSARCRCVYCYASAGHGESSTDLVFSGINLIVSDGYGVARSKRFNPSHPYCTATVDVDRLRNDRRKYSSFYESIFPMDTRVINSDVPCKEILTSFQVNPLPFVPGDAHEKSYVCREIINIQSWGLWQRLEASKAETVVVGVSGGLDSTLALLVAYYTFKKHHLDPKNIIAVTMPATATSERTHSNARNLMEGLGVTELEIPINEAVAQHFAAIGHDPSVLNVVYENSQARERTQILMDVANERNGLVLGTGDMSELALGWCTYNGDHMSMYNVNSGVPKTLVKYLVEWFVEFMNSDALKNTLQDIVDTPISPELIPDASGKGISQKTEDIVGSYRLNDFFLFHMLRNGFPPAKILALAVIAFEKEYGFDELKKALTRFYTRFFSQQFKRSCMPDGPKVGSVCLSPRGDWRMPSDANVKMWITELEHLDPNDIERV